MHRIQLFLLFVALCAPHCAVSGDLNIQDFELVFNEARGTIDPGTSVRIGISITTDKGTVTTKGLLNGKIPWREFRISVRGGSFVMGRVTVDEDTWHYVNYSVEVSAHPKDNPGMVRKLWIPVTYFDAKTVDMAGTYGNEAIVQAAASQDLGSVLVGRIRKQNQPEVENPKPIIRPHADGFSGRVYLREQPHPVSGQPLVIAWVDCLEEPGINRWYAVNAQTGALFIDGRGLKGYNGASGANASSDKGNGSDGRDGGDGGNGGSITVVIDPNVSEQFRARLKVNTRGGRGGSGGKGGASGLYGGRNGRNGMSGRDGNDGSYEILIEDTSEVFKVKGL